MEPDDDSVGRALIDDFEAARDERLHDSRTGTREHPRAGLERVLQHVGGRLCTRRDVVAVGVHSHRRELADVVLDPAARVVRDERDAQTGTLERSDGVGRSHDRLVPPPQHAVEIDAYNGRRLAHTATPVPPGCSSVASARARR